MPEGTPVDRHWVLVLKNGRMVIEWGEGHFQDVLEGEFIQCRESDISHAITDKELTQLERSGKVSHYDRQRVYFIRLPEHPSPPME